MVGLESHTALHLCLLIEFWKTIPWFPCLYCFAIFRHCKETKLVLWKKKQVFEKARDRGKGSVTYLISLFMMLYFNTSRTILSSLRTIVFGTESRVVAFDKSSVGGMLVLNQYYHFWGVVLKSNSWRNSAVTTITSQSENHL